MLGVRPMIKYQRLQSTSIKKLLTSSHPTTTRSVLEAITPSVTAEMNEDLLKEFIREEEVDLKPMEPLEPLGH